MTKRMLNIQDSADSADCDGFCGQSALPDVVSLQCDSIIINYQFSIIN